LTPPPPPPVELGTLIVSTLFSASAAASTFTVLGVTVSVAQVVGTVALTAANIVLGAALAPSAPRLDPQTAQQNLKQPIPPRRRYYGRVKIGGVYALYESKDGTAYDLFALCDGPIDAFEEYWLGDVSVSIDGSGNVTTAPYVHGGAYYVSLFPQSGTASQTAHTSLTAALSTVWTSAHRLRGVANVLMQCKSIAQKNFLTVYPNGIPAFRTVIRGAKVYDPRDGGQVEATPSTWTWSENAILAVRDYLTHADGYGLATSLVANETWTTAANIADENITLKSGGTEKRYRIAAGYDLFEPRGQTLRRLLSASDASLYLRPSDGTVGIFAGKWVAPTVTLGEKEILSYQMSRSSGRLRTANTIRARYTSPSHDYQAVDSEPWVDAADVSLRGELENTLDLSAVPSFAQCRRLQKIAAARANPSWSGTINTTLAGFEALDQRVITVQIPELSIDETFEVLKVTMNLETLTATIDIQSLPSAAYDWNAASEEGTAPPVPPASEASAQPTPANLTATSTLKDVGAGVVAPIIRVVCDAPTRSDLTLSVEWTRDGVTEWQIAAATPGVWVVETPPLAVGLYDVRAQFLAAGTAFPYATTIENVSVTNSRFLLLEDGASFLLLEDGASYLILE
jgi:hypothetical protein